MTTPHMPLPWAFDAGMDYSSLPIDDTPDAGHCPAWYLGDVQYGCTEADGHAGRHRAGDFQHIVAEWEA